MRRLLPALLLLAACGGPPPTGVDPCSTVADIQLPTTAAYLERHYGGAMGHWDDSADWLAWHYECDAGGWRKTFVVEVNRQDPRVQRIVE